MAELEQLDAAEAQVLE
jgi:hypothetical protein